MCAKVMMFLKNDDKQELHVVKGFLVSQTNIILDTGKAKH